MPRSSAAIVTPALLRWAREQVRLDVAAAAKKATVTPEKLQTWETGTAQPTLRQARLLAAAYGQPFAAFYLSEPPNVTSHVPKDYRRLAGTLHDAVPPAIHRDVIGAWDKRAIALELAAARGESVPALRLIASLSDDAETVGETLRDQLGVSRDEQFRWRDPRVGFNTWRDRVQAAGVMVLQTAEIALSEMRAYSLYAEPLPVVVLNRKDVPAARTFSLLHELVHLALHTEGICDLSTDVHRSPEEQRLEIFCNAAAAACLMPRSFVRTHAAVSSHDSGPQWDESDIQDLARSFAVSREAMLRRLLTLRLTTKEFYEQKRAQYQEEYLRRPTPSGFVTPAQDALSLLGRPFVRLVLDNLEAGNITTSDASDYLGVRLKHLGALSAATEAD